MNTEASRVLLLELKQVIEAVAFVLNTVTGYPIALSSGAGGLALSEDGEYDVLSIPMVEYGFMTLVGFPP